MLSNMIAALYLFDTNSSSLTANSTGPGTTNQAPQKSGCPAGTESILAPDATFKHINWSDICIKPSMIVIHYSDFWGDANATLNVLDQRQLGCQFATDDGKQLQALYMYKDKVERAACVQDYNNFSINNEITGTNFDAIYKDPGNPKYATLMKETDKAIKSTCWQMKQYNIGVDQVYGHLELNPGRKVDPGKEYINYFRNRLRKECK
jgi:N-acetyl-anhydromuramyl-L-alanine amidase AmpD